MGLLVDEAAVEVRGEMELWRCGYCCVEWELTSYGILVGTLRNVLL